MNLYYENMKCHCNRDVRKMICKKQTENYGREFYTCPISHREGSKFVNACSFFIWHNDLRKAIDSMRDRLIGTKPNIKKEQEQEQEQEQEDLDDIEKNLFPIFDSRQYKRLLPKRK